MSNVLLALTQPLRLDTTQAACLGYPPDWWFPEGRRDDATAAVAISICRGCPIRRQCLTESIVCRVPSGIFGGMLETDRLRLIRKSRKERSA